MFEIPTTTYLNPPANFLASIFGIAGYVLSNVWWLIAISLGIAFFVFIIYLIKDFFS